MTEQDWTICANLESTLPFVNGSKRTSVLRPASVAYGFTSVYLFAFFFLGGVPTCRETTLPFSSL